MQWRFTKFIFRYEVIYINLSSKPEWLYDISPLGKIPALELENNDVLYESLIIADYIDEKYHQNPLHHRDPLKKAKDKLLIEQFSKVRSVVLWYTPPLVRSGSWLNSFHCR